MDREVLKFFDLLFKEQSKCIKNAPELVKGGEKLWLWKLWIRLIADLNLCTGKTDI